MKTYCTLVLTVLTVLGLSAQTHAYWLGGTPGKETNWEEPRNWDTNKTPDENTYVVITSQNSGHDAQPVINTEVLVASIQIHPGAMLTVEKKGQLTVDISETYSEGIQIYGGALKNMGFAAVVSETGTDLLKQGSLVAVKINKAPMVYWGHKKL